MLWKLLFSCFVFFTRPFHGPPVDDIPYEASPFGPQSYREAHVAMQAIQGENDDMRFHEDWPESAGIKDEWFRWPGYPGGAVIPYDIDPSVKQMESKIHQAMNHYHNLTCIRFVRKTDQRDYIRILADIGCYSYVGNQHRGGQPVSLGKGCEYVGTIIHELGHAIGLYHEHQRSDRDQYITVYPKHVISGQLQNFYKTDSSKEMKWGKYDYTSIMHYGEFAFSRDSFHLKTMEAKDGTPLKEPYEKYELTEKDISLIKKLYKC